MSPDALRQIRGGHPWVYRDSIESISHDGRPGDLAVVFDRDRKFAAIGLWDPHSPICLKVLHTGQPTPIDREFWRLAVGRAVSRRGSLVESTSTTGIRLIHGENDGLPSLVVDRYGDVVVVKLYSSAWLRHLEDVLDVLDELVAPASVVLRLARIVAAGETHGLDDGSCLRGDAPGNSVAYQENDLRFEADPIAGQKTGAFLDQRENRALIRTHARDQAVLDVFSYAGGFSVHAAAGGARLVHSVDQSPHAITTAAAHMTANAAADPVVAAARHETTVGDAFAVMADLAAGNTRYGVVVVDPPSFAQRQSSVAGALRAYQRLTELAVALTEPGGLLLQASCSSRVTADNFHATVLEAAARSGRPLHPIERTAHPIDHPIGFPQGAYLKAVLARVDS